MSLINYAQLVRELWGDEFYQADPGYEWSNARTFNDSGARSGIYNIAASSTVTNRAINAGGVGSDVQQFAITGQAAALATGKYVTLDAGSFAVSADAASVRVGDGVAAAAGSLAVTGNDATFYLNLMRAVPQTFSVALTGDAVTLTKADPQTYTLSAAAGSVTITDKVAILTK